ncbi:MAG: N-methyltryptophan oxidase [Algoriphagus sp. 32-45-6]|jgi:sarcosine oxidase|nr:MAG: N-methyltryptophan oxidase [Algoriphagus sp. 32-45-6]
MTKEVYDVAVIGCGAVGSAATYHLSKFGLKVIGLDRFHPPHLMGSSHGETRITRLAVGEGEDYVALAKRSHEIWRSIQSETGRQIYHPVSGILLDSGIEPWAKHGSEGFFERTVRFAQSQSIAHEVLSSDQVYDRFSAFLLPKEGKGYFEIEAGYVLPELAIETQITLAKRLGAVFLFDSPVLGVDKKDGLFELNLGKTLTKARKIVCTAGGWVLDFLPQNQKPRFQICRQILHWIKADMHEVDWSDYPVWMWGYGPKAEDFIYGFPSLDGESVKMATESFVSIAHPDLLDREVKNEEQDRFWEEKVAGKIRGLKPEFLKSTVCYYTVTEDARFVMEPLQGDPDFLLVSACSGHGFKHSAALGEVIAKNLFETIQ